MKKKFLLLTTTTILCLSLNLSVTAIAISNTYNSKGKILFNNGTSETSDDIIFDSNDLIIIDTMITNGKALLSTALNAYPNTNISASATFAEYASAIDTLTEVPDVYYYDKSTEGDICARYIYEDGLYYPCDEYGIKTSDTALTGTVTIVTKDDTSIPGADEIQLVKYTQTQVSNLSAGSAGYVDKTFILGSGADNIEYYNKKAPVSVMKIAELKNPTIILDVSGCDWLEFDSWKCSGSKNPSGYTYYANGYLREYDINTGTKGDYLFTVDGYETHISANPSGGYPSSLNNKKIDVSNVNHVALDSGVSIGNEVFGQNIMTNIKGY